VESGVKKAEGLPEENGPPLNKLYASCQGMNTFGKFSIRHKPGTLRKIPFTGETKQTKMRRKVRFVSLGTHRQRETADGSGRRSPEAAIPT
jgi:hypothetical protein